MTFKALKEFIQRKLRMSHVYQPMVIRELINSGGRATIRQLALSLLSQDESQIKYYEDRVRKMPVSVLKKHGIVTLDGDLVTLNTEKLSFQERSEIRGMCEAKLQEFILARGEGVWEYRFLDDSQISGSLRIKVLELAKGKCQLCGTSVKEAPIDVDHIIPRSKGGATALKNLQALCYRCNRGKGNRSSVDYREWG
jgi:ATP adenylyltransferase